MGEAAQFFTGWDCFEHCRTDSISGHWPLPTQLKTSLLISKTAFTWGELPPLKGTWPHGRAQKWLGAQLSVSGRLLGLSHRNDSSFPTESGRAQHTGLLQDIRDGSGLLASAASASHPCTLCSSHTCLFPVPLLTILSPAGEPHTYSPAAYRAFSPSSLVKADSFLYHPTSGRHEHLKHTFWIWISVLPHTTCITLGKLFNLPVHQHSHLKNGEM